MNRSQLKSKTRIIKLSVFSLIMMMTLMYVVPKIAPGVEATGGGDSLSKVYSNSDKSDIFTKAAKDDNLSPTVTFSNTTAITSPDSTVTGATPFPSTINVTGQVGTVATVQVTINNVTTPFLDQLDMLLVSPSGAKYVFMSDISAFVPGGMPSVTNQTYTITDAAGAQMPFTTVAMTGTYKPTDFGGGASGTTNATDPFTGAPAGPYRSPGPGTFHNQPFTMNSTFMSTTPNGNWDLYVFDDFGDPGSPSTIAGGWTLDITLNPPTAAAVEVSGRVLSGATGRGIYNARVRMVDVNGQIRYALTNPFGYYRFVDVEVGNTYTINVRAKGQSFNPSTQIVQVSENISNLNFFSDE